MLLGLHLDGTPHSGLDAVSAAETATGPVDVVHWFQAWRGGYGEHRADWLDAVTASGRRGLVTWEPYSLLDGRQPPDLTPAAIARGHHDHYLRSWADGFARRTDGPWYVRLMHEMNGTWYPWGGGGPGADPGEFRAAWTHVRALFDDAGVSNIAWVWCPLADDVAGPFEAYHPGADQVDVLALDGYNWGARFPAYGGWRTPAQIFDDAYHRLAALGPQPIWLAEVGCAPEGGDKAGWLADLLSWAGWHERIEAVVFFSLDKERDWRVHHDPDVATALRAAR